MNSGPEPSDESLAAEAAAGSESAFEALLHRYQGRAYRLSYRLVGPDGDPQDAVQEAFLNVFRGLSSFRCESSFSTWLYRIVTNAALMQRRTRSRRPAESLEAYMPRFGDDGRHAGTPAQLRVVCGAEELLDQRLLTEKALGAIDRLPEIYRAPLVLRDLEELPTAEVAQVLGLEPAAVRQRVHRARLMLRGYLSELVEEKP